MTNLTNSAGDTSHGDFSLTNTLPATFVFDSVVSMSAGVACPGTPLVGNTGPITCTLPPIPATDTAFSEVQIRAIARSAGQSSNVASIDALNPAHDTNSDNDDDAVAVNSPGPRPQVAPEWHKNEDPGYPYGWFSYGYGYGDFDHDYCDFDCF